MGEKESIEPNKERAAGPPDAPGKIRSAVVATEKRNFSTLFPVCFFDPLKSFLRDGAPVSPSYIQSFKKRLEPPPGGRRLAILTLPVTMLTQG